MTVDIERNLARYLGARDPTARYTSYDYCFNYFQGRRASGGTASIGDGQRLEISCLHLGFYLASWGMLRGSAELSRKSLRHLAPVIDAIVAAPEELWSVDADDYSSSVRDLLLDTGLQIRRAFPEGASDILVTKIMLGVFGCVPAFDTYFKKGFGASTFGDKALRKVGDFYADHADVIDKHRVPTLSFETGLDTEWRYTRAKVIDMIFFIEGGYDDRGTGLQ